ncbi:MULTISPECIES: GNAT family N-acetyltransferase [unclassified Pseudomonas]|uniref:GNAT family N-acetyltransferase n=1 Tax=unclassified Pseudomonas TaxID=196821 RepID=UPI00244C9919|nr:MULTISPECIES: GNAT family N-acetyltransferase [unclassified Pseudomonas]MDH0301945.1 GNAT family N-acetyltransferase [Pseudomonas sp. GD04091]MDH1985696.1 GNAT family N-acetyltransferase [Pseudomonas sp. GD03689]
MCIRPTLSDDVVLLPAIERSAAQAFRALPDLAWLADSEVMDEAAHQAFVDAGRSWVAVDGQGRPVGFLCALVADAALHIQELSVARDAQGHGLGRRLLDQARQAAQRHGLRWLTLTTFADVPWNAPFYERYGFERLPARQLDQRLQAIIASEQAHGLAGRCAMRLLVDPVRSAPVPV